MQKATIYYAKIDDTWTKEEKLRHLDKLKHINNIEWQKITPDKNYTWLTDGLADDFDSFISIGNKETKEGSTNSTVFLKYSRGVATCRDTWAYNFDIECLLKNIKKL